MGPDLFRHPRYDSLVMPAQHSLGSASSSRKQLVAPRKRLRFFDVRLRSIIAKLLQVEEKGEAEFE